MYVDPKQLLKRDELAGVLERICQALEWTETQHNTAKEHYEAVGKWLSEADDPILDRVLIYPQGSAAIGTTVKPLSRAEHDVDLVSFVPRAYPHLVAPATLKTVIGNRLRSNGRYAPILEEKPRCWRLNFAGEFHLDITPSIKNLNCPNGGELVPDKKLKEWKPSNPRGYKALFERRAALQPRMRMMKAAMDERYRADAVAPFPEQTRLKGVLRRTIQLAKRNRDIYFQNDKTGSAPISVIITTLASRSYEHCVQHFEYDTEFDLLSDIVRHMPDFIEVQKTAASTVRWTIRNETTAGENFAEKWNAEPRLATAFYEWHAQFLRQTNTVADTAGMDKLNENLSSGFGSAPVKMAFDQIAAEVAAARSQGRLALSATTGLMGGGVRPPGTGNRSTGGHGGGTPVRRNTFFGAD